jgi:hypothetical protein
MTSVDGPSEQSLSETRLNTPLTDTIAARQILLLLIDRAYVRPASLRA